MYCSCSFYVENYVKNYGGSLETERERFSVCVFCAVSVPNHVETLCIALPLEKLIRHKPNTAVSFNRAPITHRVVRGVDFLALTLRRT